MSFNKFTKLKHTTQRTFLQRFIFFLTYEWPNKLECLSMVSLSSLVSCLGARPEPTLVEYLLIVLGLPAKNKLGWKSLSWTNNIYIYTTFTKNHTHIYTRHSPRTTLRMTTLCNCSGCIRSECCFIYCYAQCHYAELC